MFILTVLGFSCGKTIRDDNPQYFGHYFNRLDTISDQSERLLILDSVNVAIHAFPAGDGDKIRFFKYSADAQHKSKNFERTFLYIDSIQFITGKRINEDRFIDMQSQAFLLKSDCYKALKNYDAAAKYLLLSKTTLGNKPEVPCKYAAYNERTADLFYRQGQYAAAISYYKKAIQNEQECTKDPATMFANVQRFYDDIGLSYAGAGKQDSAAYFFQTTLDYISTNEHRFPEKADYIALARAVVYANVAKIKRKQALLSRQRI